MNLKGFVLGALALLALVASSPAQAAGSKFWVVNHSGYDIVHVYADNDTSGGSRDLMGQSGVLTYKSWKIDQVQVLRPKTYNCWSNVAVVNDAGDWAWFYSVNICDPTTHVHVFDGDFQ